MAEAHVGPPELLNIVTILARKLKGTPAGEFLLTWENIIFSLLAALIIFVIVYIGARKITDIPRGLQNVLEMLAGAINDFVCGILGEGGKQFVPFIGTLFIYILFMNFMGLVPMLKSPTSSWSVTLALAICVFFYVQYTAIRRLGLLGYVDHLAEKPRGFLACTVFIPILMFCLHLVSEFVKPISLSLRLRSNIWGEDMLLAVLAGFGITGVPLILFNSFLTIIAAIVQALVFCLLTTIYLALVLPHEHEEEEKAILE